MSNPKKGQTMIEVIIALLVAGLVAAGLIRATTSSVRNVKFSQDQNLASTLAQKIFAEQIEAKNNNPAVFWSTWPSPTETALEQFCYKLEKNDASSDVGGGSAKMARLTMTVYWDESDTGTSCNNKIYLHQEKFETYVTN